MANRLPPRFNILNPLDAASNGNTLQKLKFSINDFFSKSDQIRGFLGTWITYSISRVFKTKQKYCGLFMLKGRHCNFIDKWHLHINV